ncbi:MAG: hypothetical protein MJ223_03285 [Mycoplasmoidaceae bacterium]|nr:hypothetical protein [Mycoplasmoidaceae bacterium]
MEPDVIIFDEVTSMLDNKSKANVQKVIKLLQTKFNKTIILITHDMDEAALADNIIVLSEGKVALCGKSNDVFQNEKLNSLSLHKPLIYKVVDKLGKDFVRKVGYEKDSN